MVAGAVAARLARVPHVWHVREILSPRARSLQRWVLPRFASRVLCISQAVRSAVAPYAANVEVLADGVDPDLFRQEAAPAGRGDVLMVARTHPEKGHEVFIRAAARVAQTVPGARFAIIGGTLPVYLPLQQRLAALADSLGLDERLEWVPHLSREELARCLASASVIVVPSTWTEPGGLVVLEAMACARPVVAPDRGGPAEVISNGVNGLLVEVAPEPIAAAIESLLRDPDQRRRIGEMARRRVVESYSLGAHLQRLAAIYEEVS